VEGTKEGRERAKEKKGDSEKEWMETEKKMEGMGKVNPEQIASSGYGRVRCDEK